MDNNVFRIIISFFYNEIKLLRLTISAHYDRLLTQIQVGFKWCVFIILFDFLVDDAL